MAPWRTIDTMEVRTSAIMFILALAGCDNMGLIANPSAMDFGRVSLGHSAERALTLTTTQQQKVTILLVESETKGWFELLTPSSIELLPDEPAQLKARFHPCPDPLDSGMCPAFAQAELRIVHDGGIETVSMVGSIQPSRLAPARIEVSEKQIELLDRREAETSLYIRNVGSQPLSFSQTT